MPHFNAIPLIRRGILASVSSVYDPLGMVAPFLVTGKQIPQELFKKQTDWDEPVLVSFRARWEKWRSDLHTLEELKIRRCYRPDNLDQPKSV